EFTFPQTGPDRAADSKPGGGANRISGEAPGLILPGALAARKPGFLSDRPGVQNFQPAAPNQELTILLVPEAAIVGRVVLPTTDGSDNVEVEIYRRQAQQGPAHWQPAGRD